MKIASFLFSVVVSFSASATPAQVPNFPTTFPKAYKKLGNLEPGLQSIGNDYCQQAQSAPGILPQIANQQYKMMLSQEIVVAAVLCKNSVYVGFPQTPKDENLKFFTDFEVLRLVTFKLFALYKLVPGSQVMIELDMKRLRDLETIDSSFIGDAYNPPGSQDIYPPTSDVAAWVSQIHDLYAGSQIH